MPEEIEVDTDKLREQIDEEIEKEGGRFIRMIALTTAILAALAAIASLRAGATVNEALALKTEATQIQARASDQWAYYQAKGIKGAVAAATVSSGAPPAKHRPPRPRRWWSGTRRNRKRSRIRRVPRRPSAMRGPKRRST